MAGSKRIELLKERFGIFLPPSGRPMDWLYLLFKPCVKDSCTFIDYQLVHREGFEPPKPLADVLQTPSFNRLHTYAFLLASSLNISSKNLMGIILLVFIFSYISTKPYFSQSLVSSSLSTVIVIGIFILVLSNTTIIISNSVKQSKSLSVDNYLKNLNLFH